MQELQHLEIREIVLRACINWVESMTFAFPRSSDRCLSDPRDGVHEDSIAALQLTPHTATAERQSALVEVINY